MATDMYRGGKQQSTTTLFLDLELLGMCTLPTFEFYSLQFNRNTSTLYSYIFKWWSSQDKREGLKWAAVVQNSILNVDVITTASS